MEAISPVLLAIPFFFLLMGIEWLIGRFRQISYYNFADTITNLNLGVGNQAFGLFFKLIVLAVYVWIYNRFAIWHLPQTWQTFAVAVLLFDFIFYWAHRIGHEVNFFWGAHLVHHQSEEYNLSVALRQSWFHTFLSAFLFLPVALIGFDPLLFGAASAVNTLYQFWIHTKAIDKLPRFIEYIFNTPSHHRVHHATNLQYIDKNHGGILIIWDRLFGTFQEEQEQVTFGITQPLRSLNPVWANAHFYADLWQKMKTMPTLKQKWQLWWAGPDALADEKSEADEQQIALEKTPSISNYAPQIARSLPRGSKRYVAAQLLLVTVGLMGFMYYFDQITWVERFAALGFLLFSGLVCSAVLENKQWLLKVELMRFASLALLLLGNYLPGL